MPIRGLRMVSKAGIGIAAVLCSKEALLIECRQ